MSSHIYHGLWINWSRGGWVTGAEVTLSQRDGGLLTSFIAAFVTLVGAQLWKILSFMIHQVRSTNEPRDSLYHQQQVLWRNVSNPGAAAWSFVQQSWFWRSRANRSFLRTVTWALFAIIYLILFTVAAIFSSEIAKAPGSQRLVVGDYCGYWVLDQSSPDSLKAYAQKTTNDSQTSAAYARACYNEDPDSLQCGRFAVPYIPWTVNTNASCPFESGLCYFGDTAAFEIESQLIDTQNDLGINTMHNQRLQYQKRTTCAPIHMKPYVNITHSGNETYWDIMYGPLYNDTNSILTNYTTEINTHGYLDGTGYNLLSYLSPSNDSQVDGWKPIPALFREDADVLVVFLVQNSQRYGQPVDDPWFSAHLAVDDGSGDEFYLSDQVATTLGCIEQYRYCNPNNNLCTDYFGKDQLFAELVANQTSVWRIGFNLMQLMLSERLLFASSFSSFQTLLTSLDALALRAQTFVNSLDSPGLPSTQWHTEVTSWFGLSLASIQQHTLSYASGPTGLVPGSMLQTPEQSLNTNDTLLQNYMCRNQIINDSSDSVSFSVLGLGIVFALGGLIIVTSLVIDRVVGLFQKWFKMNLHGRHAWILDDKLHMQKAMFEKSGLGRWQDGDETSIPVTTEKSKFSRFPADQLYSPNTPDTPMEPMDAFGYDRKTEYLSESNKTPGVYVRHSYGSSR